MINVRWAATLVLASALCAPVGRAQVARRVVRVRVADSSGVAVVGAEVSVVRGLNETRASGVTDDAGNRLLLVPADTGVLHLVVRKIGFIRAERFFRERTDTITLALRLSRAAQELGAVKVTARESTRQRKLYIDADAIANSDRMIANGNDIIERLRPDMIWGLGGPPNRAGVSTCPKLQSVWINGSRITQAPGWAEEIVAARTPNVGLTVSGDRSSNRGASGRVAEVNAAVLANAQKLLRYRVPFSPASILTAIRPEHIAELKYNDCFETEAKLNRGANSVFVVLKPGIGYSPEVGSYVVGDESPLRPRTVASIERPAPAAPLERYRFRLLRLYDEATGAPIADAEVTDTVSDITGRTSETGTISFAFLPDGGSVVRIKKLGYETLTLRVAISPRDTVPITLTLKALLKPRTESRVMWVTPS